ncbi:MAG: hypothetical protein O7H41_07730 [Planctomycetota bacterium]|nr:hypothetical protein [Planctomycetota bacterium]
MARCSLALLVLISLSSVGCIGKRFVLEPGALYPANSIIVNDYQPRDVPIPRGFRYLPKESHAYVGAFRVVDAHYVGETLMEQVASFLEEQMPLHGWTYQRRELVRRLTLVFVNPREECYVTMRRIDKRTELRLRLVPRDVKPYVR